ncbi:class I adenylate-forming enzyme family protein [Acrocarpospora macrocephala]|uniref:Fatty acid--CoA ligase n=1 Tax=Acrocarpospora macrocephala TaxID=150177 RepID=A0A5M3WKB4_9ACTN|nr:class I adenylate-forming enzyme family protein [Acrocarpospora macrocephala]GES09364.1 fatty acid--CoA ligase [Acrocarpospora macrocephala]
MANFSVRAGDGVFVSSYDTDPRLRALLGPGASFETEEIEVDGVTVRSFVRALDTIVDAFQSAQAHADKVHLVFEDERLTFADVRRQALSVAQRLKSDFGIAQGDRVAIAMRNFPEFVAAFWGAAVLGAIVVPLNSWWTGSELHYAIRDSGAELVFADEERIERLSCAEDAATGLAVVGVRTQAGDVAFENLANGRRLGEAEFAVLGPDDPVTILYTSGTTGRPKGALGTSRGTIVSIMNMGFMAARAALIGGHTPASVQPASLAVAPLFHVGGIASIVGGAMSGLKIVLMRRWNVEEGLALAEREQVTSLGGTPTIARQILEHPDLEKFKLQVNAFAMGGASVPPDLPQQALEAFGASVQLLNGYGATETTSGVVGNVGSEYAEHLDSVGRPNPTTDLRVVDPHGCPLSTGEIGELCFRSPQIVKGYWNNPAATRAAFVDGWYHSGDLGYVDGDGFVYVVDRLKDVVIRGGENVYSAEVEAVLFEHPEVADVAVVGVPERAMGERVCAVVVPRPGFQPRLDELRSFTGARLAAFKCPEALYLTGDVPRTATGKIAKKVLREEVANNTAKIQQLW